MAKVLGQDSYFFCARKYGGLRLESVTPTALKRSFYIMIHISLCLYLWQIALKKRNAYGVEEKKS